MESYVETFFETHVWDTNWKVLAENFMESYHLPVCHAGTIGGLSKLDEMVCPPGLATFNFHTILKDDTLKIALAHPVEHPARGRPAAHHLPARDLPEPLVTLTPGYFWYLTLHPQAPGQVRIGFGGGMSPDFVDDPDAQAHFAALKTLLDEVNVEDRGCTEKVFRGLSSALARPGHLRTWSGPNYDFARYLCRKPRLSRLARRPEPGPAGMIASEGRFPILADCDRRNLANNLRARTRFAGRCGAPPASRWFQPNRSPGPGIPPPPAQPHGALDTL